MNAVSRKPPLEMDSCSYNAARGALLRESPAVIEHQQPKNQPTPPNVMHPIAPRRRPFRPQFTYLFRLVLARSRCPSVSQASHFLAHLALLVPPEALCSPATSPKFSKRCPYGARLAPATGGAPATFSAAAARPPQQSSRRAPGGGFNPRPAPLFLLPAGGRVASQTFQQYAWENRADCLLRSLRCHFR